MASTYTSTIRLSKQGTGDNTGTWGVVVNNQLDLLDATINGFKAVTITDGLNTLSVANGSADDARYRSIHAVGALTTIATMVAPDVAGFKVIGNYTTGAKVLTYRTSSGTGVSIPASTAMVVYSDGTTVLPLTSPMSKNQSIGNLVVSNLVAASVSITTIFTAVNASVATLTANGFTCPTINGTSGAFTRIDATGTVSTATLKAASLTASGTVAAAIVSCDSIGVSTVDASRVSASSGYFGTLYGGTVAINSVVTVITGIVTVSNLATSLSAGTGWEIGSLVYTPRTSASRLEIEAFIPYQAPNNSSFTEFGIFTNASTAPIDYYKGFLGVTNYSQANLIASIVPATTGPYTVSIRYGASAGSANGFVGTNGPRKIRITEYNS